jgi:serine/threonine-protein kinase HipA
MRTTRRVYWTYQHLMSVNGKFRDIMRDDLLNEADRYGVRRPLDTIANVREALGSWGEFAKKAGLGGDSTDRVAADFWLV